MAYETGTPTTIDDLMTKLATFVTGLSTTPWTQENTDLSYDWVTFSRGTCYVSFRWNSTTAVNLGVFQSLGYGVADGTAPHLNTDDSGNGSTTAACTSGRRVNFTDGDISTLAGPYVAYHFFANEGSSPWVYVVVETATGVFRHFGWGESIDKYNDYTGGAFVYGHQWSQSGTYTDTPTGAFSSFHMDGLNATPNDGATVHLEGLPDQDAAGRWGVTTQSQTLGNDRAGEARLPLFGGARAGLYGYATSWMRASELSSYKPLMPILLAYRDQTTTPDTVFFLGEIPGVAIINMSYYTPGDEFTISGDTYMVFPWVRKQHLRVNTEESWNAGIAYLKEV